MAKLYIGSRNVTNLGNSAQHLYLLHEKDNGEIYALGGYAKGNILTGNLVVEYKIRDKSNDSLNVSEGSHIVKQVYSGSDEDVEEKVQLMLLEGQRINKEKYDYNIPLVEASGGAERPAAINDNSSSLEKFHASTVILKNIYSTIIGGTDDQNSNTVAIALAKTIGLDGEVRDFVRENNLNTPGLHSTLEHEIGDNLFGLWDSEEPAPIMPPLVDHLKDTLEDKDQAKDDALNYERQLAFGAMNLAENSDLKTFQASNGKTYYKDNNGNPIQVGTAPGQTSLDTVAKLLDGRIKEAEAKEAEEIRDQTEDAHLSTFTTSSGQEYFVNDDGETTSIGDDAGEVDRVSAYALLEERYNEQEMAAIKAAEAAAAKKAAEEAEANRKAAEAAAAKAEADRIQRENDAKEAAHQRYLEAQAKKKADEQALSNREQAYENSSSSSSSSSSGGLWGWIKSWFAPVVLDLDGDGVELIDLKESSVLYDVNGDGYHYKTAWVKGDDGFLAYDFDNNGVIDQRNELSFVDYLTDAKTDLEGVNYFDTNGNGMLDKADEQWEQFGVWQDRDQDGITDVGEFNSLTVLGIESIDLSSNNQAQMLEGNRVHGFSQFTRENGTKMQLADTSLQMASSGLRLNDDGTFTLKNLENEKYWFDRQGNHLNLNIDTKDTEFSGWFGMDGNDYIRVSGNDGVMLNGESGDDTLIAGDGDDVIVGGVGADNLYGGAGDDILIWDENDKNVKGGSGRDIGILINSISYSTNINMRDMEIEVLYSSDAHDHIDARGKHQSVYIDAGSGQDTIIGTNNSDVLIGGLGEDRIYGANGDDFIYGGKGNDFLKGGHGSNTYFWNLGDGEDRIVDKWAIAGEPNVILLGEGIEAADIIITRPNTWDLAIEISDPDLNGGKLILDHWYLGSEYRNFVLKLNSGTEIDIESLLKVRQGTDSSDTFNYEDYLTNDDEVYYAFGGDDYISAYGGNDQLYGGEGNDVLSGMDGNDDLYGNAGEDELYGGKGNDVLYGGMGDDKMYGGYSGDTYKWGIGDGNDLIFENDEKPVDSLSDKDKVVFGVGIEENHITWQREKETLIIAITSEGGEQTLTIKNWFKGEEYQIEIFELYNGANIQVDLNEPKPIFEDKKSNFQFDPKGVVRHGTSGYDYMFSSSFMRDQADIFYGYDGNDEFRGGYGEDHLFGGAGNDFMRGDHDKDTYYWGIGDGNDRIIDARHNNETENNVVVFGEGIKESDLSWHDTYYHRIATLKLPDGNVQTLTFEWWHLSHHYSHFDFVYMDEGSIEEEAYDNNPEEANQANTRLYVDESIVLGELMKGTDGRDKFNEYGTKNYTMLGLDGNDALFGAYDSDWIYGGAGDDWIYGRGGDDVLFAGEAGNDNIFLGVNTRDSDVLVWAGDGQESYDKLWDFELGLDLIDLRLLGVKNDKYVNFEDIEIMDKRRHCEIKYEDNVIFLWDVQAHQLSEKNFIEWRDDPNANIEDMYNPAFIA